VRKYSLLLLIIALLLAACNGDATEEEQPTPRPTPTTGESDPTEPTPDAYPVEEPTEPASSGYPAEGSEAAEIWVVLPQGAQCAESLAYPTADSAVADLEAAGVEPLAVEETELLVCEACGCPTSAHYRVLLSSDDVPTAISLGWQVEP
jgi:hypothetical protein